jgi:hypothetical protein
LNVKRAFKGDNSTTGKGNSSQYEAAVSDDGALLVAIDTTCDEEVLCELRARQIAAAVQKLRKSAGLVLADKVEVFYHCTNPTDSSTLAAAIKKHASSTLKRIKTIPFPAFLRPRTCIVVASEVVDDAELASGPVTLTLTVPTTALNRPAVAALSNAAAEATAEMYLQTKIYESVLASNEVTVTSEGVKLTLRQGVHYFPNTFDLVLATQPFPEAPTAADLQL